MISLALLGCLNCGGCSGTTSGGWLSNQLVDHGQTVTITATEGISECQCDTDIEITLIDPAGTVTVCSALLVPTCEDPAPSLECQAEYVVDMADFDEDYWANAQIQTITLQEGGAGAFSTSPPLVLCRRGIDAVVDVILNWGDLGGAGDWTRDGFVDVDDIVAVVLDFDGCNWANPE